MDKYVSFEPNSFLHLSAKVYRGESAVVVGAPSFFSINNKCGRAAILAALNNIMWMGSIFGCISQCSVIIKAVRVLWWLEHLIHSFALNNNVATWLPRQCSVTTNGMKQFCWLLHHGFCLTKETKQNCLSGKESEQWLLFTVAKEKRDQTLFAWYSIEG